MNNLVDSGLNLKTIEVRNLHQIVSDLNYNFTQMLHLPGFKGQTGATGASTTGAVGQRGNMWIFADSTRFISAYTTITSAGQVTLAFLNSQVTSNLATLLTTLQITSLVHNDVIVLPSRDVIQFNSTTNAFVDTGIRFADGLSLTEAQVITIVNNILNGLTNNDVYTTYKGVVKNYADNGAGLNTEQNYNSILDIPVSGAGSGVISTEFLFTSLKEAVINNANQNMLITGSPKKYHDLAQATMTNKTVDYMAGVDDFGALAVMQNSYKNGILLGHRNASDFSTWGRIFRTENKLRFLSDYHPILDSVGRLDLAKEGTELYSPKDLKILIKNGNLSLTDYNNNRHWLYANNGTVDLGNTELAKVQILTKNYLKLFSSIGANTELLGLYNNEVKASNYQPKSDVIVNDATKLVTHNLFYAFQINVQAQIDAIIVRLNALETQKVYKQQTYHQGNVNANTLTQFGLHIIQRISTATYTNFPNSYLSAGFSQEAWVKVNTFIQGSGSSTKYFVEQELVQKNAGVDSTLTSKRRGISTDNGTSYTWSEWTYILDSDNFKFKEGTKMDLSSETFGDSLELTFNHKTHTVSTVQASNTTTDSHKVIKGVALDTTGHPITPIEQDLDDWYYDKPEIDEMLRSHIPIGSIIMWSGAPSTIPNGFLLCDGTNGTPNMKGRFVVGHDSSNTEYSTVGAVGGSDKKNITVATLPPHSHSGTTNSGGAHTHGYSLHRAESKGKSKDDGYWRVGGLQHNGVTQSAGSHSHTFTTSNSGGGEKFDVRPSYYVICYIQFIGFGAPSITAPTSSFSGTVGTPISITPTANGTVTSWSASGLPSGLTINTVTGVISGVPTSPITTTVTLVATNSLGTSQPFQFGMNISPAVGSAPIITSDTTLNATQGLVFLHQITASGSPTSYSVSGLPSFLTLNTTSGLISGLVPNSAPNQIHLLTISATNASGSGTANGTLAVNNSGGSGSGAPILFYNGNRTFTAFQTVDYIHLSNNTATTWTAVGLPTGLSINPSDGRVTGNPTSLGMFNVTVTASNSAGTATTLYRIKILA